MTATYVNDPTGRPIDTVRFEVDDRDTANAVLSDEEIQYLIDSNSHILLACAAAADAIGAKYASEVSSKQVGDLRLDYGPGGVGGSYGLLAKSLRLRAVRKAGSKVYAGGLSKAEKITVAKDTDRVLPVFVIGMDDSYPQPDRGIIDY